MLLVAACLHTPRAQARAWDSCSATSQGSFQHLGLFSSGFLSLKGLLWCK